jgi:hypothetical protein
MKTLHSWLSGLSAGLVLLASSFLASAQSPPLDPWKSTVLNGNLSFNDVTFSIGRFVAVGNVIATSTDGAHWTICATNLGYGNLQSVTYSGNGFVAVGLDDVYLQPLVSTSPDGTNWTSRDVSNLYLGVGTGLRSVAFGNGRYVATVAGLGGSDTNTFAISTNGINWSLAGPGDHPTSGNHSLACANELFVNAAGGVYTSTDGDQWIQQTNSTYGVNAVIYAGGRFLAIGDHTQTISSDGTNWMRSIPPSVPNPEYGTGAAYGDGFYLAMTFGGWPFYSTNGLDWTGQTYFEVGSGHNAVAFGNGVFVSVGGASWDGQKYVNIIHRTMSAMHLGLQGNLPAMLSLSGLVPGTCSLECTESLDGNNSWSLLAAIPFTNSPTLWIDETSTNVSQRFYRVIWNP